MLFYIIDLSILVSFIVFKMILKLMKLNLPIDIEKVKGFLDPLEGEAYTFTQKLQLSRSCTEIGSYCGKSAVYIGSAAKRMKKNSIL